MDTRRISNNINSERCKQLANRIFFIRRCVANGRGRVLGGSSAINAGFYSRADDDFFKQLGFKLNLDLVNSDGLLEANVTPYNGFNLHHVVGTKIGESTFDGLGRRHSAADLLNHARPSNIMVALHASVERILFNTLSSNSGTPILSFQQTSCITFLYYSFDGRRVLMIERDLSEPDKIVGELLQPGGYLKLIEPSLQDCVKEIDAQRVLGYALSKDGQDTRLSYPLEKFHSDVVGRSFHNGRFIQRMREKAASLPK
ncbi:hypothetical protein IFM89_038794 [Coptis chinensis]|uniref:Squalene monooxygenase n=1 Tax=Coptis chinensis TaxID=261450 RepID=A0A835J0B5_9MAGN|nr:hypothetical protein IFM89_038794 [Coptis chinensis]